MDTRDPTDAALRRVVVVVALAKLAYFFVEFAVARRIATRYDRLAERFASLISLVAACSA
jgi:transposase